MAANSARSLSPLTTRPINQSTITSESNLASRRSFSGSNNGFSRPSVINSSRRLDPNAPANSPADCRRRSTTDACLKNLEEKENDEKDTIFISQKMTSPGKNCKNFMAPTISAASKFCPSPRKKVFTERNDAVPKRVTFALSDSGNGDESSSGFVTTESGSPKLQSSLKEKLSYSPASNCIAPLDADPSMPPYDPKTNYLSPRPKFLHYKPNPRFEIFLNREKEDLEPDYFRKLEDSLMAEIMSETISDSDYTEESEGGDSVEGELEPIIPYDMVIGLNGTVSSHGNVVESKDENLFQFHSVLLPCHSETKIEDSNVVESKDSIVSPDKVTVVEGKEVDPQPYECSKSLPVSDKSSEKRVEKKSWAFSRLMRFTLLLTFLISCASMYNLSHSPSFGKLVLTDSSLSNVSSLYQQSRLAANHLSADLVSVISKLATDLGRGGKLVQLQFMNLSDLQEVYMLKELIEDMEVRIHNDPMEDDDTEDEIEVEEAYAEADSEDNFDKNFEQQYEELEENPEAGVNAFQVGEEADGEFYQQEFVLETEVLTPYPVLLPELEFVVETEVAATHDPPVLLPELELVVVGTEVAVRDPVLLPESEHPSSTCQDHISTVNTLDQTSKLQAAAVEDDDNSLAPAVAADIAFPIEVVQSTPLHDNFPRNYHIHAIGISSLLTAAMLSVALLVYRSKRKPPNSVGPAVKDTCPSKKIAMETSPIPKYDDDISKSYDDDFREVSEVQSIEGRSKKFSRRESLASSSRFSTGCASYGSFTTFERIPIKTDNGEEEMVTPVRRSSRIRKHHISPA